MRSSSVGPVVALLLGACAGEPETEMPLETRTLRVTLANLAQTEASWPSAEAPADILLSVGLWAVHAPDGALLRAGTMASGTAIEELAERGDATQWLDELADDPGVIAAGLIDERVPGQSYETDPIGPGTARAFEIEATEADRLSIAMMFVQSNDTMLATVSAGIALDLESGVHDVTSALSLWDAGTELNEAPATGENQAPRQTSPDAGIPEGGTVQPLGTVDAQGYAVPTVATFARLEIEAP